MSYVSDQEVDKEVKGFAFGTLQSTILATPVDMHIEIFNIIYNNPGTINSMVELVQSRSGTITGTVNTALVDGGCQTLAGGTSAITPCQIISSGKIIGKVDAGEYLLGRVLISGSIQGIITYKYALGRMQTP